MRAALLLAAKDLRILLRDPVALFWVFGFPLLFALFLGAVMRATVSGEASPFKVAVVDRVTDANSARWLAELADSPRFEAFVTSIDHAQDRVRRSAALAYVELRRTPAGPGVALELGIDPLRKQEAALLRQELATIAARLQTPAGVVTAAAPNAVVREIAVGRAAQSASEYVFPIAVLWGLIGCAACFAISMVAERTRGTFLRLAAAPIGRGVILGSKALACWAACLVVSLALLLLAMVIFDVEIPHPARFALALLSAAACFVGITMALSLLGKSEQAVAGAGWATLIVMAMLGGGMVPLSLMPDWLLVLSHLSPVKWSILALEGALWREFSLRELIGPCALLVGVGAAGFALGLRMLSLARA